MNEKDSIFYFIDITKRFRIGEELIRPSLLRPVAENEALSMSLVNRSQSFATSVTQVEGKVKNQYFFNSSNSEVRMLSSLIIIKTLHQGWYNDE